MEGDETVKRKDTQGYPERRCDVGAHKKEAGDCEPEGDQHLEIELVVGCDLHLHVQTLGTFDHRPSEFGMRRQEVRLFLEFLPHLARFADVQVKRLRFRPAPLNLLSKVLGAFVTVMQHDATGIGVRFRTGDARQFGKRVLQVAQRFRASFASPDMQAHPAGYVMSHSHVNGHVCCEGYAGSDEVAVAECPFALMLAELCSDFTSAMMS